MTDIIPVSRKAADAAADALSEMGVDWGACGDVREGRVDHPLRQAFARFEQDLSTDKERLIEALRTYDPKLYGEEKWETTLANIAPILRGLLEQATEPFRKALAPFAKAAAEWEEMGDTRLIDADGMLTVEDLRRARATLQDHQS